MSSFRAVTEFAISFGAANLAVLSLNPLAKRFGWVDRPQGRKDHEVATPVTGGLAIAIGVLLALPLGMTVPDAFYAFCLASCVLLVVGILDDLLDLSWRYRLLAQCAAALIMVYLGSVRAEYIGLPGDPASIDLGMLTVPFTVFITIGIINAINMADGADGLAGGVTLISMALLALVCERVGNYELLDRIVILGGAVAGFLVMNMRHPWQPRAQAFLGNSGSAVIGLAITWLTIRISHTAGHPVSSILGPWLVAPPLIDCVVLMLRRVRQHRSPFSADRNHMHHLLIDAGFPPSQVALLLAALTALCGMSAMFAIYMHVAQFVLVAVFLVLIGTYYAFTRDRDAAVRSLAKLRSAVRTAVAFVARRNGDAAAHGSEYPPPRETRLKL